MPQAPMPANQRPDVPVLPYPLTTLHAIWPWAAPPVLEVCRTQLSAYGQVDRLPTPPGEPSRGARADRTWALALEPHAGTSPVFLWPTPAEPLSLGVLAAMLDASARERKRFHDARWHLIFHQLLDPDDPAAAYHRMLRLVRAVCPELPALYDAESLLLRPGAQVLRIAEREQPPPAHELYRIHAVLPDADFDGDVQSEERAWLHTHGLERAGLPELEVNEVPATLATAAGRLLNLMVACCLGDPEALEGDQTLEVVRGHPVRVRPLEALGREVVPPPGDPARGWNHGGRRVALVDARVGRGPPLGCLEALSGGAVVSGGSEREALRSAERARNSWSTFGMAFATHRKDPAYEFLVQLGYPVDDGRRGEREHLWFQVLEIAPGRIRARLCNAPVAIQRWREGDVAWHELERLSDWTIHRPEGALHAADV